MIKVRSQRSTLSILRFQPICKLCDCGHLTISFFLLIQALMSGKQLKDRTQDVSCSPKEQLVIVVLVAKSCPTLETRRTVACQLLCLWDSPGKNAGVGCHFLLQGIFLTQGSNLGLLHCRQILYQLSYEGSPRNN